MTSGNPDIRWILFPRDFVGQRAARATHSSIGKVRITMTISSTCLGDIPVSITNAAAVVSREVTHRKEPPCSREIP